jgi:hypothetical protein
MSPAMSELEAGSRMGAGSSRMSRILLMGLKRSGKSSIYQVRASSGDVECVYRLAHILTSGNDACKFV